MGGGKGGRSFSIAQVVQRALECLDVALHDKGINFSGLYIRMARR